MTDSEQVDNVKKRLREAMLKAKSEGMTPILTKGCEIGYHGKPIGICILAAFVHAEGRLFTGSDYHTGYSADYTSIAAERLGLDLDAVSAIRDTWDYAPQDGVWGDLGRELREEFKPITVGDLYFRELKK